MDSTPITKVAIVEDDLDNREVLRGVFEAAGPYQCVGEYGTGEAAVAEIRSRPPDIILMDIGLPGMSGIEAVCRLKEQMPATRILMLTVYDDDQQIFSALESGADGYLLKRASHAEMLQAIQDVMRGGAPMTGSIARRVIEFFHRRSSPRATALEPLTSRERQILEFLAAGYLYKEIGDELEVKYETVHTHVRSIYEKLHVHSRGQAVNKYLGR